MNKKIYLIPDGTDETGKKIISYLESLGGINTNNWKANTTFLIWGYFINSDNIIELDVPPSDYTFLDINNLPDNTGNKDNLVECFEKILKNIELNGTK